MHQHDAARNDRFLEYLEERIKAKRAEYARPDTSARARDILETEIAEVRAICRAYREQLLDDCIAGR
jgi:hypothetical protein